MWRGFESPSFFMPVEPIYEYGLAPSFGLVNETGVLVRSVTFSPERDVVTRKGSNRADAYERHENPRLGISFEGEIIPATSGGAAEGLAQAHPGASVDLANAADGDNIHGFDIDGDNLTVVMNPTRTLSDSEAATVTIPAMYKPFISGTAI